MPLQISNHIKQLGLQARQELNEQFARIDAIAE